MSHNLYLWIRYNDTETSQQDIQKMLPMDTSDRDEAIQKAVEWMFHHVRRDRDLVIRQACLYSFSENILHLHAKGLKEKLTAFDAEHKEDQIRSLEQQLRLLKGEGP